MFSYYGAKTKIIDRYPAPKHDLIIEPFAGSARYALKYYDRDVILCDVSPYVVKVWEYLIKATKADVLSLPDVPSKVSLNEYDGLTDGEKYLIGFGLCRGKSKPRLVGHGFNSWAKDKVRIADTIDKIKHWTIVQRRFESVMFLDTLATWFIDPPCKEAQAKTTDKYLHWQIDYTALAKFIKTRRGQVIACEGPRVDYLPFEFLALTGSTSNRPCYEYIYEQ